MLELLLPPPQEPQVKPYAEVRERYERRIDRDFDSSIDDGRSDLHSRWRVGAKFPLGSQWRGELRYQYAHSLTWTPASNFSTWNSDVDLAYVETTMAGGTVTLGRQKIAVGNQRLIGPLEWVNLPRSFDGVRFKNKEWDLWAALIGLAAVKPRDARIAAISSTNRAGMTSLIFKHDETAAGDVDIYTLNHWHNRTYRGTEIDAEAAVQGGDVAGKDQEGWALHLRASRAASPGTRLWIEGNIASGGGDAGTSRTFDNLYPGNHDKYGSMDMQGWKNMRELAVGVDHRLSNAVTAKLSWHGFMLQDAKDAWYAAGGAPNRYAGGAFVDPTGDAGRDVGSEIDLEFLWSPSGDTNVSAGVSTFQPGRFIKRVAGSDDSQFWGYLQGQWRF